VCIHCCIISNWPCMIATHSTTGSSRQVISVSLSHYISLLYQGPLEACANQLQKSYQSLTYLIRSLTSRPYLNGGPTTKDRQATMSLYFYSSGAITWLTLMQQKVFWGDDTTSIHRRLAPRTGSSPPHRHNFFDFLQFR
jgi:hypothetical protein